MKIRTLAIGLLALSSLPALAQAGRSTIDLGGSYIRLGDAVVDGPTGAGAPALAGWDVGNRTAVMLNYEYRPWANVGLQLVTTLGGSFKVTGLGSLAAQGELFQATPYSATLLVNYHFFDEANALRPFLGIGANYTGFSSVQSTTAGQAVDMSSGFGLALQAGARYMFDKNWSVFGSLGLNWTKSDVTISGTGGPQTATIDFRPVTWSLGVGYSF